MLELPAARAQSPATSARFRRAAWLEAVGRRGVSTMGGALITHPDLRQIAVYALPVLLGACSLACIAIARTNTLLPRGTSAPMASFTATTRTPHSAVPTATRLKDEDRPPLEPSPTLGPHPPAATPSPALSQLLPGTYLITSPRNEDGLLIRTLDGKLVASVPQPESEPDWNAKYQKLAFTQRTNHIGILEFPYLEVQELANIPPGTTPSWSPEGGMFVYVYYSENPFELPQGLQIVYPAAEWTSPVPLSLRRLAKSRLVSRRQMDCLRRLRHRRTLRCPPLCDRYHLRSPSRFLRDHPVGPSHRR